MVWVQAGVAEQLVVMLESSSPEVRAVACACLGDLAASHPPLQPYLTQVPLYPTAMPSHSSLHPRASLNITGESQELEPKSSVRC